MNSIQRVLSVAGAATTAIVLTACGSVDLYGANNYPASQAPATYPSGGYSSGGYASQPVAAVEYGRITDVKLVSGTAAPRGNHLAGTAIGAIIGGVLGNQIGSGSGRSAATVLGAAGGAMAGNQIARRNSDGSYASNEAVYRISVQTDNGEMRQYDVSATGDLQPGDRVRIENGVIYHA